MKESATMTPRFGAPCAPRRRYTGNTRYTSCPQLKETKIMAALTLGEWRDRTLEQVHFAAKAALDAVTAIAFATQGATVIVSARREEEEHVPTRAV
jgi:hypothetical protein